MERRNTTVRYNGSGNFPERLHYVLGEMTRDNQERIMCWDESGCGFKVHDRKLLEREVLPTWFRQTKYTSFQRQLNIYGFTRVNRGPQKGTYYHALFRRNMPELTQQIPRTDIKKGNLSKTESRQLSILEAENILDQQQQESSNHISAELIQSSPPTPIDDSLTSMSRLAIQARFHISVPRAHSSGFKRENFRPVSSCHSALNCFKNNSISEQDVFYRTLCGSNIPTAKAQELINRTLAFISSNGLKR